MLCRMCWSNPSAKRAKEKPSSPADPSMVLPSSIDCSAASSRFRAGARIHRSIEAQIKRLSDGLERRPCRTPLPEAEAKRVRMRLADRIVVEELLISSGIREHRLVALENVSSMHIVHDDDVRIRDCIPDLPQGRCAVPDTGRTAVLTVGPVDECEIEAADGADNRAELREVVPGAVLRPVYEMNRRLRQAKAAQLHARLVEP